MKKLILLSTVVLLLIPEICCQSDAAIEPGDLIIEESTRITDVDGNVYRTARIGDQIWMAENLNVSHFRNGDVIPQSGSKEEWVQAALAGEPAWSYYDNDPENGNKYGKLYNWFAVMDPRGLAPEGWHIPSDTEWTTLTDYSLGENAGFRMKSTSGWNSNGNGDNSSLFNALPGGGRTATGDFDGCGTDGLWWSALQNDPSSAWGRDIKGSGGGILRGTWPMGTGLSVRATVAASHGDDSWASLEERLQKALDDGLNKAKGEGVSAAVIFPDGSKWVGVSGVSHGSTKLTTKMRFSAGSIEKIFTAAAILQLAEEGMLAVDDTLDKWLPPYPYIDGTITIRQLLNHTSGLYHYVENEDMWTSIFADPTRMWTPEEFILAFNRPPYFPKGTGWHYSQTGYNLLKMIVMEIAGTPMSTVNKSRFFDPLGLTNSFTSMGETLPDNIAHGWFDMDNDGNYEDIFVWPRTAFASGIGGEVWSTAEDLAKWARVLFYDKTVLTQSTLDEMLTFHTPCTGEEFVCAGYGLGVVNFNPQILSGLEGYGHSGHGPGYAVGTVFLPKYNVCLGYVDNTDGGESVSVTIEKLLAAIIGYLEGK